MTRKEESRMRAAKTTRERHGKDFYRVIGEMGSASKTKEDMRLMALKRWHPTRFDEQGNYREEE